MTEAEDPPADAMRDFDGDPVPLSPPVLAERPEPDDGTPWPDDAGLRGRPLLLHSLLGRGYRPRPGSLGGSAGGTGIGFGGLAAAVIAVPMSLFFLLVAAGLIRHGAQDPASYAIGAGVGVIAAFLLYLFARNGLECLVLAVRAVRQIRADRP